MLSGLNSHSIKFTLLQGRTHIKPSVRTPIIFLTNFEQWNENNFNTSLIKEYKEYSGEDKKDYFIIEINSSPFLGDFDKGDLLVFLKKKRNKIEWKISL